MKDKRALITGITGFVGSHLAEYLLANGIEVYGTIRWRSKEENISHIKNQLNLISADLRDATSTENVIKKAEPDYIFHLAAQSFVPMSWHAPQETITTNIISNLNILEAVRKLNIDPVIQIAGSSEEYGHVYTNELPLKETNPLRPLSPYAVSKVGQDMLSVQYHRSYGLKTVITRAFNHTGPRRGEVFVTSNFSKQIAEIEKDKKEPILYVGSLTAKRDFSDVRDIVKAYWLAVNKCIYGEVYNICSGKSMTIEHMLNILLSLSIRKDIKIKPVQSRMRPSDVEILEGDCSKFMGKTGWKPEIPFEQTLKDLLDYWRSRV